MEKIYNKNGSLTIYAFKIGYRECYEDSQDWRNSLLIQLKRDQISDRIITKQFFVKGFVDGTYYSRVYNKVSDTRKFVRRFKKLKRIP